MQISINSGKIIALTGGIASGKSFVLSIFKDHGFNTISADDIVKELYNESQIINKIARLAPNLVENNKVNIAQLRLALTKHPKLMGQLHKIMLPAIKLKRLELFKKSNGKTLIYEIPLLFETNQQKDFDLVMALNCPKSVRLDRALLRGTNKSTFDLLNKMQHTDAERAKSADIVINTDLNKNDLNKQIEGIICQH